MCKGGRGEVWSYDRDHVLILWECFLEERYQTGAAADDPNLRAVWVGFEAFLLARFPATQQLVTTATDPLYESADYQRFLAQLGYSRLNIQAYGKTI